MSRTLDSAFLDRPLTQDEIKQVRRLLSDPLAIPEIFKNWIIAYIEAHPPVLPISQILGFASFTPNFDSESTSETTTSTSYTDLATVGPSLADLSDGRYLVLFGATAKNSGANTSRISVKINSTEAVDSDSALNVGTNEVSIARGFVTTLEDSFNTLTCRYKVSGGTGTYQNRWLAAIKYSNV